MQGLTLRFQARGPKRSFDKKVVVKNRISGYYTISGPMSEKSKGQQQNLGAYAPGKSNPVVSS